jgi:hypothetical protein
VVVSSGLTVFTFTVVHKASPVETSLDTGLTVEQRVLPALQELKPVEKEIIVTVLDNSIEFTETYRFSGQNYSYVAEHYRNILQLIVRQMLDNFSGPAMNISSITTSLYNFNVCSYE